MMPEVVSRDDALARGLSTYFNGRRYRGGNFRRCTRGHIPIRYVCNGMCVECAAVRDKERASEPARKAMKRSRRPIENSKRRALLRGALPAAFGAFDQFVIEEAAAACRRCEERHGEPFHVDHIVPLSRGGLHAWHNIQVIPARLNLRKNNSMMYQTIAEWLADA